MDPKDRPDFHPSKARVADVATMDRLAWRAADYREANRFAEESRTRLREAVRAAKESGHSYSQIMEATGLSLGTVQRMTS